MSSGAAASDPGLETVSADDILIHASTGVYSPRQSEEAQLCARAEADGLVRQWRELDEAQSLTLGHGSYGAVRCVRLVAAPGQRGREFAVKEPHARFGDGRTRLVLEEFEMLRRLKLCWCERDDFDDRQHLPFAVVAGVFLAPRPALLLEYHGCSLYDALHSPRPGFPLDAAARNTVARHVASGLRFMHGVSFGRSTGLQNQVGIAHRDLKAQNVLVDPARGYTAKLTDFGTSHMLAEPGPWCHTALERGTDLLWAPELIRASVLRGASQGVWDEQDEAVDFRAVDCYAFGVLLCQLWSGQANPFCALPRQHAHPLTNLVRTIVVGRWRPAVAASTPPAVAELVRACWAHEAAARPSFSSVCAQLAVAAADAASRPVLVNAVPHVLGRLVVFYRPWLVAGASLDFAVQLHVCGDADAMAPENRTPEGTPGADGAMCVSFSCLMAAGDTAELVLEPAAVEDSSAWSWLRTSATLQATPLPALDAVLAAQQPVCSTMLTLSPDWGRVQAIPEGGLRCGVRLELKRITPMAGNGAASVRTARSLGTLSFVVAREQRPVAKLGRMPTALRARHHDCMLSYRERDTGETFGDGFVRHLQGALEAAGYSVFVYSSALTSGDHWTSVLTHGIQQCSAFLAVCSEQYGDAAISPWSYNEIISAQRQREQAGGRPFILPIWHSARFPPGNTGSLLSSVPRVPAGAVCAKDMPYADTWPLVLQALADAGVHPPSNAMEA